MKRKFLSILLTLTMALTLLPTAAMAEGEEVSAGEGSETPAVEYVAQIGDKQYATLQEAFDAAKNKTVKLLANVNGNFTISQYKTTLDLNGFTINGGAEASKATLTITNNTTIKDSSAAQTGTIMREDTAENSGVSSYYVIDIQGKNGFLSFEGGNVKNDSGIVGVKGSSLVRIGDDSVSGWPTLTIKGGTFTQNNFIAIKVDRGTLHLIDGEVNSANSYAIENWNKAYIKGGTVNGTVSSWVYSTGAAFSKLEISGGKINGNVASVNYDKAADKQARIYVTGGEVTGTLGTYTYDDGLVPTDVTAMATVEVTGGSFDKDPSKYVTEDAKTEKNGDGSFGVSKVYLCKIGNTGYYTMDEAFHAVESGETITMLHNYTTNKVQNSGYDSFAIDLNGFTWTYTGTDTDCAAFEINYPDVTLTVKNGKIVSGSMVGLIPSAMGGKIKYDNSGLVFEDVEATANGHSGIETNGNNTNDSVTLKNSTLNVSNGFGIYFPSSGKLTIDNSTINAKTMGVQVCAGSLSINAGSTITVSGDAVPKTENDGAIQDGAAISIVNRTGYKDLGDITVTGGTFTAKDTNAAIKAYNWENKTESDFNASDKVSVSVSGGTFTSEVPQNCCAPGFVPKANSDGTYGVEINKNEDMVAEVLDAQGNIVGAYGTLAAAITEAKNGETVKLLKDVTENVTILEGKSITLDLNGKNIAVTSGCAIVNKGTLTVTGSGNVTTSANGSAAVANFPGATANLNGGTYSSSNWYVIKNLGTMTIDGPVTVKKPDGSTDTSSLIDNGWYGNATNDLSQTYPTSSVEVKLTIKNGAFEGKSGSASCSVVKNDDYGVLEITGGTFDSTSNTGTSNATTILNWNVATISGGTFKGSYPISNGSYGNTADQGLLTISGGDFIGTSSLFGQAQGGTSGAGKVTITDGSFKAHQFGAFNYAVEISGGTFSFDPSTKVKNNGTDYIVKRAGSEGAYTYTVLAKSGLTSGVYLTNPSGALASNYYVSSTANGVWTVSYSAPSSGGGSSSSSRRYDVSAPSVKHGDVTVSPKNASKGDTVTITVKPDSGYELDTLTVKDASGSKIKVKDKGDGKFTFTMPASKVTVSAEFAEIETLDFADVSTDAYYYEAVKWAAKKGITGGTGDGTFNPNGSCTRAHIVTFLWRAAGSPEPKSTVSFADVPAGSYYAKAVAWAVENGITLGTGDGTFSPNATCTRAQSVTFLYRALGTAPTTVNGFTDVTADAFYADAVAWAVESGVTNGTSASTFSPNNGCTRAQIVTFLYRTMK